MACCKLFGCILFLGAVGLGTAGYVKYNGCCSERSAPAVTGEQDSSGNLISQPVAGCCSEQPVKKSGCCSEQPVKKSGCCDSEAGCGSCDSKGQNDASFWTSLTSKAAKTDGGCCEGGCCKTKGKKTETPVTK